MIGNKGEEGWTPNQATRVVCCMLHASNRTHGVKTPKPCRLAGNRSKECDPFAGVSAALSAGYAALATETVSAPCATRKDDSCVTAWLAPSRVVQAHSAC